MITFGDAGLIRLPGQRKQMGGLFLWQIDEIGNGGRSSFCGHASLFWLDQKLDTDKVRLHLMGFSEIEGEIGAIIAYADILNDLSAVPLEELIRDPLDFVITEVLEYNPAAVNKRKITLTVV